MVKADKISKEPTLIKGNLLKNLIILCGVILIIFSDKSFLNPSEYLGYEYDTDPRQYKSKDNYLEISKNASKMGPLIEGDEGQYRIHFMNWNDPAFPILISVLAFFGIEFHSFSDLVRINLVLFWFSLLCFSLLFLRKNSLVFGAVQFLIILYINQTGFKNSVEFVDQHSTVIPLTILTFILVEVFFKNKNWSLFRLFTLAFCGGLFGMFRNYFTYAFVLLIGFFSKNMFNQKQTRKTKFLLVIYSLIAILFTLNFSSVIQRGFYYYSHLRNPHLSIPDNPLPPYKHGIWYAAYIGLGFLENKWGIQYMDEVGIEHAQRHDPTVQPWSRRHYIISRELYFKYLKEEPVEYIKNHLKKSCIVIFEVIKRNCYLTIIFLLIFLHNILKFRNRVIKKEFFPKSVHIIPLFIFFIVPVVTAITFSSFIFAITNYLSLIIITLIVEGLDINTRISCKNEPKMYKIKMS